MWIEICFGWVFFINILYDTYPHAQVCIWCHHLRFSVWLSLASLHQHQTEPAWVYSCFHIICVASDWLRLPQTSRTLMFSCQLKAQDTYLGEQLRKYLRWQHNAPCTGSLCAIKCQIEYHDQDDDQGCDQCCDKCHDQYQIKVMTKIVITL